MRCHLNTKGHPLLNQKSTMVCLHVGWQPHKKQHQREKGNKTFQAPIVRSLSTHAVLQPPLTCTHTQTSTQKHLGSVMKASGIQLGRLVLCQVAVSKSALYLASQPASWQAWDQAFCPCPCLLAYDSDPTPAISVSVGTWDTRDLLVGLGLNSPVHSIRTCQRGVCNLQEEHEPT